MGTKRLTKLDRMTPEQREIAKSKFWSAPINEYFEPVVVALVLGLSEHWLQKKRCTGDGIPFHKVEGSYIIKYKKSDVINYIEGGRKLSTSAA